MVEVVDGEAGRHDEHLLMIHSSRGWQRATKCWDVFKRALVAACFPRRSSTTGEPEVFMFLVNSKLNKSDSRLNSGSLRSEAQDCDGGEKIKWEVFHCPSHVKFV